MIISHTHHEIPSFSAYLYKSFLQEGDNSENNNFIKCEVYAVSSYSGHAITFKVLLDDGSMFDYIPIHAIRENNPAANESLVDLDMSDLVFQKNCPDNTMTIHKFKFLTEKLNHTNMWCWFKHKNLWLLVTRYVCSIDWPEDNHSGHLVFLENGQMALVPNHKALFSLTKPKQFPNYKKIRSSWIIKEKT